jgi:hypothetical protein
MFARRFQRVLVLGAVVVGTGLSGAGVGHAATLVPSDQVKWSGKAVANPDGSVDFQSSKCQLTSDGEATVTCQLTGHATVDATGVITGTSVTQSSDGTITDNFTSTPDPSGSGAFTTKGKCTEKDTAEPGQPPPHPYPCREKGKGVTTANPDGTYSIKSQFKVLEKSTAP